MTWKVSGARYWDCVSGETFNLRHDRPSVRSGGRCRPCRLRINRRVRPAFYLDGDGMDLVIMVKPLRLPRRINGTTD